ncbi:hypothetical protein L2E82_48281 [Cichorium intybus]|uniref:Uncharacterized protein n=1 Tax=Cichorium intybus TaxID=13427 RepID=A0ACB8YYK6_CICIN|nr:hypothetical protein L2E82_48281 [Cichorium intybus]
MKVGTIKRKLFPRIFKPKITKPYNFKALFEGLDAFLILSEKKVGFGLGKFMGNGLHTLRSNLFDPKKVLQSWDPTLVPGSMLPAMLTTMLFSPSWFDLLELDNLTGGFVSNFFVKYLWVCNKRSKQETFLVDKVVKKTGGKGYGLKQEMAIYWRLLAISAEISIVGVLDPKIPYSVSKYISCSFILKAHKRKGTALNMRPTTDYPVTLTAEEKLNVTLKRDDGLSNFDVQGTF